LIETRNGNQKAPKVIGASLFSEGLVSGAMKNLDLTIEFCLCAVNNYNFREKL
jgi:hypothetical protein